MLTKTRKTKKEATIVNEISFEDGVQEMTHFLNLPFLSKKRKDSYIEKLRNAGWSEDHILRAENDAAKRSNWNKKAWIEDELRRNGARNPQPMAGFQRH